MSQHNNINVWLYWLFIFQTFQILRDLWNPTVFKRIIFKLSALFVTGSKSVPSYSRQWRKKSPIKHCSEHWVTFLSRLSHNTESFKKWEKVRKCRWHESFGGENYWHFCRFHCTPGNRQVSRVQPENFCVSQDVNRQFLWNLMQQSYN